MSGSPVITSQEAPREPSLWQRIADASKDLARPFTIYMGGTGVFWGCVFHPSPEVYAIAASMTGVVSFLHGDSKVKLAQIAADGDK